MDSRYAPILILLSVLLGSCQTDGISLEQAKTITVMNNGGFVAPRNVTDVVDQIHRAKPDLEKVSAWREIAAKAEPSGITSRWRFLRDRSHANEELGRSLQALLDLRASYAAANGSISMDHGKRALAVDLAAAEIEMGNFDQARSLIRSALAESHGIGLELLIKQAEISSALGDRPRAQAIASIWQPGMKIVGAGPPDYSIPYVRAIYLESRGLWGDAEKDIRDAIERYKTGRGGDTFNRSETPNWVEKHRLHLVDNLLHQGRYADAEIAARETLTAIIGTLGRQTDITVGCILELAKTIELQERPKEALELAHTAISILDEMDAPSDALTRRQANHLIGRILLSLGDYFESEAAFERARIGLADGDHLMNTLFRQSPDAILALAATAHSDAAVAVAREMSRAQLRNYGKNSLEGAEATGILAYTLARAGSNVEAVENYRAYTEAMADRPSNRRRLLVEDFADLLARSGQVEEEFIVADGVRNNSVGSAIQAVTFRQAAHNSPETADMVRQWQDLNFTIDAYRAQLARLLALPADGELRSLRNSVQAELQRVESASRVLQQEIGRRLPDHGASYNSKIASKLDVAEKLRRDEVLISILVGSEHTQIWALRSDGALKSVTAPIGRGEIASLVADVRKSVDIGGDRLDSIPEFDVVSAQRLYRSLLEPVSAAWKDAKSLIIVADGPLNYLPFTLLPENTPGRSSDGRAVFGRYRELKWLGLERAISTIPSIASLVAIRSVQTLEADRKAFVGFGNPWFSAAQQSEAVAELGSRGAVHRRAARLTSRGSLDDATITSSHLADLMPLPETATEIRSVAKALGADEAGDVFLGKEAREDVVKSIPLADRRVVMFATHGLVAGDLDGLTQPALALSNPSVVGGSGDGLLTMEEVMGLKLNADWVVLSACNTAAADGAGAEAVSGLGRAFFYAGTRAVLVTHWAVETESARLLTNEIFRRQAADPSLSRAEALRQAMVAVMNSPIMTEDGRQIGTYSHPVFWAPFALVGDGG